MTERYDIAIIGAGIAGASLAAELGPHARVLLIEAEQTPGYHATGRSAAFWTESYGGPGVQPLTSASGPILDALGVLRSRGALTIAREGQTGELDRFARSFADLGVRVERLGPAAIAERIPGLRPGWVAGAYEPDCSDIDVAALHQHYLAQAGHQSVDLVTRAEVVAIDQGWILTYADGNSVSAEVIVNAAGAWADRIAELAGVPRLGIQPYRRTVAQLRTSPRATDALPLVLDLSERFYFKPEAGRLWLSPHDETPTEPCDAAAEEEDVALAIERLGGVVDWHVERVEHRWAGLRSFAPDRLPVYGIDARNPKFFWFAGQGGFGIQTAPAAAQLAAALLLGQQGGKIDPRRYSPARFG